MVRRTTKTKPASKSKRIVVHPEIHKAVKHIATEEDLPIQDVIHRHLCHSLGMEHLMLQAPDSIHSL